MIGFLHNNYKYLWSWPSFLKATIEKTLFVIVKFQPHIIPKLYFYLFTLDLLDLGYVF